MHLHYTSILQLYVFDIFLQSQVIDTEAKIMFNNTLLVYF